jgi:hypothetical protein
MLSLAPFSLAGLCFFQSFPHCAIIDANQQLFLKTEIVDVFSGYVAIHEIRNGISFI